MRDPKRILAKLLGGNARAEQLEATGEPLEMVAEVLRDVVKSRKTRNWLLNAFGIDLALSPQTFDKLLDIPQINFIETPNRSLEIEVISLRETRSPGDPVSVGNLNSVLRELYRTLHEINETRRKDCPDLLLAGEISASLADKAAAPVSALRGLNSRPALAWLSGWKARSLEREFQNLFPRSGKAHPLRQTLPQVERELDFYRMCREAGKKWEALGLDMLRILREDTLPQGLENIEELGNQLWNIVYKHPKVQQSLTITGIQFGDVRPLFDETLVPINNV